MSITLLNGKDKQYRGNRKFEKAISFAGRSLETGIDKVSMRIKLTPTPFPNDQTLDTDDQYGHGEEVHYMLESLPQGVLQASVNYREVPSSTMAPTAASKEVEDDTYPQQPALDVSRWRGA